MAERKQISKGVYECERVRACTGKGERLANMDSRFSSPQWLCKGMKGLHQGKGGTLCSGKEEWGLGDRGARVGDRVQDGEEAGRQKAVRKRERERLLSPSLPSSPLEVG